MKYAVTPVILGPMHIGFLIVSCFHYYLLPVVICQWILFQLHIIGCQDYRLSAGHRTCIAHALAAVMVDLFCICMYMKY